MSEMVDRIKEAINQVAQTHGQTGHLRARALSDEMAEAMAHAAIEAMCEPTETMSKAGFRANVLKNYHNGDGAQHHRRLRRACREQREGGKGQENLHLSY